MIHMYYIADPPSIVVPFKLHSLEFSACVSQLDYPVKATINQRRET